MENLLAVCLALTAGCMSTPPKPTAFILAGEGVVTAAEAAQEVQLAVTEAEKSGCEAVSVGAGTGAANLDGVAKLYNVYALVRCPAGVKLLPNGQRSP